MTPHKKKLMQPIPVQQFNIYTIKMFAYKEPSHLNPDNILPEKCEETAIKTRLKRTWQHTRDPAIIRQLNAKIAFIQSLHQIYRKENGTSPRLSRPLR